MPASRSERRLESILRRMPSAAMSPAACRRLNSSCSLIVSPIVRCQSRVSLAVFFRPTMRELVSVIALPNVADTAPPMTIPSAMSFAISSLIRCDRRTRGRGDLASVVDRDQITASRDEILWQDASSEHLLQPFDVGVALFLCIERQGKWLWQNAFAPDDVFPRPGRTHSFCGHSPEQNSRKRPMSRYASGLVFFW